MSIESVIAQAEARWRGLDFKRESHTEASAACPFCHDGYNRFHVFDQGNYWCRQCDAKGWLDGDDNRKLTPQELNEIRLRRLERQIKETQRRLTALERMHQCKDHLTYHNLLDDADREYWHAQGIYDAAIDSYLLGVCYSCPCDTEHRPSYTIPVINHDKLVNIRHRLVDAANGDKYRPHMSGLGSTLFNADNLYTGEPEVMIVEGEKKSIVLSQYGFSTVGIMGKASFPPAWAQRFKAFQTVYVALDPDAIDKAHDLAQLFQHRARVISLPVKADDFFVDGGKPAEFREFVRLARKMD